MPKNRNPASERPNAPPVVALCGGIGGAKLALGLYRVLEPGALTLIVNTGDDFEHLGLHISPDIDTVTYTLAGMENPETGWGRRDETWTFMDALDELGGETWFRLGDRDLAVHVERTRRLAAGERLSGITSNFAARLGVTARVLPMSDDRVRTVIDTGDGRLGFQDYFVRRQSRPVVKSIVCEGAEAASPGAGVLEALGRPDLRAVIICPSNPFLSIDPILAVPGFGEALTRCRAPVVAVSPLIGGRAVKGPTAKIMAELSMPPTAVAVAEYYDGILDGYVVDHADADVADIMALPVLATRILMQNLADRDQLARDVLAFADEFNDEAPAVAPVSYSQRGM